MSWREAFLTRFGTGAFSGIPLGLWLKVLRENHFQIDRPYLGRAAAISLNAAPNSFWAAWERLRYGQRIERTTIEPPLFILGYWRSGTTLLHNLLAQDDRFAYPNNYQVFYPRTFLSTERFNAAFVGAFFPDRRPQDNVSLGIGEPQEDEFALCSLLPRSFATGWAFPRNTDYGRYLTLRTLSPDELTEWKTALHHFVRKLAFKYGRRLVLKSPGHTCRIKALLELFPDAQFIHIHRRPLTVFQSMLHMMRAVVPWWSLQQPEFSDLEERMIRQYEEVYRIFFEERGLIPAGRYYELGFEQLETEPIEQLRSAYQSLGLPNFADVESKLRRYVDSLAGYKKNRFEEIPAATRARLAGEWRRCFEEWGYTCE